MQHCEFLFIIIIIILIIIINVCTTDDFTKSVDALVYCIGDQKVQLPRERRPGLHIR